MKRLKIIFWILIFSVSVYCQTDKEIDDLIKFVNSKQYEFQDSIIWIKLRPLKHKTDSLEELGKKAIKVGDNDRIEILKKQYVKFTQDKLDVLSNYPDFIYSADYLLLLAMREKDLDSREPKIGSLADYKSVYDKFTKEVKDSYYGKGLKMLFDSKIPNIGDIAPDIDFYTNEGSKITLSDYKGKFVLLKSYFCGCGGWRIEKSKINEIYNQLDTSKIVIIGTGIDNSKIDWANDVMENNFPWVSTFQPIGGKMTIIYNINSNSRSVLIDPNGKIVDMDLPIQRGQLLTRLEKSMNK